MVRKRGFEPRCSEERQPLKLVRLPVPPLPRGGFRKKTRAYFAGAGAGVAGAGDVVTGALEAGAVGAGFGLADAGGAGVPLSSEPDPRDPIIDNDNASSMKSTAATAVAFVSTVAPERAPNAA